MIILSCGHTVDSFLNCHGVMVKDSSRDGSKAISYKSVCLTCKQNYDKENYIFHNQEEAHLWLTKETR